MNWEGFTKTRHELKRPLLVASGSKGVLACGYLSVAAFEKLGDAGAIVRGVADFDAMLEASVAEVSSAAAALGVRPGMLGREALEIFR
jgi:uncharacterized protein YunC (DUF1805 family)